ncbi:rod-binding protein [Hoeflea sp. YIM 152468]|uniref:rod-binding protein n=1 Tax=Hoeflea sp. YIM 152468 TaxID=3031759 RepID=UPI0023DCD79C|nr:rod-binding protein [Hoeflea sp. YIM 152468]MDF1610121.1 rod-binding protein [Hoeflea sp. YIM 152468]
MSIQTATDIILDVVRAADPAVAKKAEAVLQAASIRKSEQAAATPAFQHQLLASAELQDLRASAAAVSTDDKKAESYQRFEAMMLQNFIGSMLPKDSEQLYGKGMSGEIWKGMMAEQLGAVLAKGGGIGIADRLMGNSFDAVPKPESADAIGSNVSNRATSLVNEVQKQILADVAGPDDAADATEQSSRRPDTA